MFKCATYSYGSFKSQPEAHLCETSLPPSSHPPPFLLSFAMFKGFVVMACSKQMVQERLPLWVCLLSWAPKPFPVTRINPNYLQILESKKTSLLLCSTHPQPATRMGRKERWIKGMFNLGMLIYLRRLSSYLLPSGLWRKVLSTIFFLFVWKSLINIFYSVR